MKTGPRMGHGKGTMNKMTKNIITRESCKKELVHLAKADMKCYTVLLLALALVYLPLFFAGLGVAKDAAVLGIPMMVFSLFLPCFFGYMIFNAARMLGEIEQGEFSVVTDTVSYLSRGEVVGRNQTADVIYLSEFGRYIPSQTVFDLTDTDDTFYVVVINRRKKVPVFVYHSMLYEYVE